MLSLIAMLSNLLRYLVFIEWSASYAVMILSNINRPGINAHWVLDIMLGRIFFNLLANTFEITLYMTLQKLIGLKSEVDR